MQKTTTDDIQEAQDIMENLPSNTGQAVSSKEHGDAVSDTQLQIFMRDSMALVQKTLDCLHRLVVIERISLKS